MQSIYLAGGCFWCTEAIFNIVEGVEKVVPGYIGGESLNPTYEQICTGKTGHAEAIECSFDENKINLNTILQIFFSTHDPTQLNRQGNDVGTQYRSAVFCNDSEQKEVAEQFINNITKLYSKKIVTEVNIKKNFYRAEQYHLNYYIRNSNSSYCNIIIKPKLIKFKKLFKKNVSNF
tara:strand:+ start:304 stop:831 length:528 start_codon:yes stop_codon:yes gene_type:complete